MPETLDVPGGTAELDDLRLRLRRAEALARLPREVRYDQPLENALTQLAESIVAQTGAISAGVIIMRESDLTPIAYGTCNLPENYVEQMLQARQNSPQAMDELRQVATSNRSWVIRNAREALFSRPEYAHMRETLQRLPYSTLVGTPFMSRPEAIGVVYLYYADGVEVDEDELAFAREVAAQAGPVMDNAWLFNEMRTRTAELEALSRADEALHKSILLDHVYQSLIDLAIELLGADRSLFLTFGEDGRFQAVATRGVPEDHLAGLQQIYRGFDRSRFANQTRELTIIEDLESDPRLTGGVLSLTTSKSSVDVPVFVGDKFYGMFVVGYRRRRTFNAADRRLFQTLASRAGLALQNALLFNQSARRANELEALYRADEALHQSLHLDDVLDAMVNLAVEFLGADSSAVLAWQDNDRLEIIASRGIPARLGEVVNRSYARFTREYYASLAPAYRLSVVEDTFAPAGLDPELRGSSPGSFVEIPVVVDGTLWGIFPIAWTHAQSFSDEHQRVFEAFAARASLAIQNALIFEESARRSRELEALRRADEALHRSLRLDDVIRALAQLAAELLQADSSLVVSWNDQDVLTPVAWLGIEEDILEIVAARYASFGRDHFARMGPPYKTALVEDIRALPGAEDLFHGYGPGSFAEVAVVAGNDLWGVFAIGWRRTRTFEDNDRRLLDAFASRAGLAIQNALVFEESARRARELEALRRADEALHRSLALEDVLAAMTDLAVDLLGADSSLVTTWDDDDRLATAVSRAVEADDLAIVEEGYRRFERGALQARSAEIQTGVTENVHTDPRVDDRLRNRGLGSVAEIPVRVGGVIWGFFSIGWRSPRHFSEAERTMFDAFAARAGLAIQNALLFEQAQASASMEERSRIARELHDSVSQALYGIGLGARTARRRLGETPAPEVAEPVDYVIQLAESGLAETRALIFELVPESLEQQGLVLALQRQAAATRSRHRIEVAAYLADEPDIPLRAKEALYRIAQESLHNMAKHAQATEASVTLACEGAVVTLAITDNGRGFDTTAEFPGHFGLRSMEERARRAGGHYRIESTPGAGTTVTVTIPAPPDPRP